MKAVVAAFNQEKALVGAFSVLTNLRMELFQALLKVPAELKTSLCIIYKPAAASLQYPGRELVFSNCDIHHQCNANIEISIIQ